MRKNAEEGAPMAVEDPEVLVLLPVGRDAQLVCEKLTGAGLRARACLGFEEVVDSVGPECGPLLLGEEALAGGEAENLLSVLDAEPTWSELPVVLLLGRQSRAGKNVEALAARPATTVARRPVEPAMLVGLMQTAVESRRRQFEVRDLFQQLRERARQLQELALESTRAEERERSRIAGILHDDLQQTLVYAKLRASSILVKDESEAPPAEAAEDVCDALTEAIESTRTLSRQLHPPLLDRRGLGPALKWLANQMGEKHDLKVNAEVDEDLPSLPQEIAIFTYQAVSELLFNVVKHAGVNRASLRMCQQDSSLKIVVEDRGTGMESAQQKCPEPQRSGFGLWHIEQRARLFGGEFKSESTPGEGSRFELLFPLDGDTES